MAYLDFKLARDPNQNAVMSVSLDQILAVIEVDQKKSEILLSGNSVLVHGSQSEVMGKIRAAEV